MAFNELNFLKRRGITLYLDVGANIGQTGTRLLRGGFLGRIQSFEPIPDCFGKLQDAARNAPGWSVMHAAIGDRDGTASLGVSANFVSSSLRPATDLLVAIHEPVRYTAQVEVPLRRLDGLFDWLAGPEDVVHLKIDTQGSEREVILGAEGCLSRIDSLRMEVAVSEVYKGEMLVPEAIVMMRERGFVLVEAFPAWRHPVTDEALHFDLVFRRGTLSAH